MMVGDRVSVEKRGRGNPNLIYHDQRHPAARFDDATVRRIRHRAEQGVPLSQIAEAVGCCYDTIRKMVRREQYAGVE